MRAVVYERYGPPDVLRVADVDPPVPAKGEVLVRVRAASINSWDWDLLTGTFQGRLGFMAWRRPRFATLGADLAGDVEAVSPDVTDLAAGDEVFGDVSASGFGGLADRVAVPASALAVKSAQMTFEQAAAMPQAGLLALQALRAKGRVESNHKVLVNGAGGGVGTFAVQIAHAAGAEVTGVDHAAKLDTVRAIGADHVMDYAQQDFTRSHERYDLIVDVVATRPVGAYRRALAAHGTAVIVGGSVPRLLGVAMFGRMPGTERRRSSLLMYKPRRDGLLALNGLFEAGDVTPVIDRVYPLEETSEAFRRFGGGGVTGKLVVVPSLPPGVSDARGG